MQKNSNKNFRKNPNSKGPKRTGGKSREGSKPRGSQAADNLPRKDPPPIFKDPIDPSEKGIQEKIDAMLENFRKLWLCSCSPTSILV